MQKNDFCNQVTRLLSLILASSWVVAERAGTFGGWRISTAHECPFSVLNLGLCLLAQYLKRILMQLTTVSATEVSMSFCESLLEWSGTRTTLIDATSLGCLPSTILFRTSGLSSSWSALWTDAIREISWKLDSSSSFISTRTPPPINTVSTDLVFLRASGFFLMSRAGMGGSLRATVLAGCSLVAVVLRADLGVLAGCEASCRLLLWSTLQSTSLAACLHLSLLSMTISLPSGGLIM